MKKHVIYFFCLFFPLLGCEKAELFDPYAQDNFEALWKILDEHYCFFDYKQIDWDEVHDRYSERISESLNQRELFDILGEMVSELKDGHTSLKSSFDYAYYDTWYKDFPDNFDFDIVKNYIGEDYKIAGGLYYQRICYNTIGYIYYGNFASSVTDINIDYVLDYFKDCKGLIIDVRHNTGGYVTSADRLASRFYKEKRITGYIIHKKGKGHSDFSDPFPSYLEPSNRIQWYKPTVVLTNRRCYSACNNFVSLMKLPSQVTVIGDRTGGGSGLPFTSEIPIGWTIRFSASPILDVNKQNTEFGIDPDIKVEMLSTDEITGRDHILEYAMNFLQKKKSHNL